MRILLSILLLCQITIISTSAYTQDDSGTDGKSSNDLSKLNKTVMLDGLEVNFIAISDASFKIEINSRRLDLIVSDFEKVFFDQATDTYKGIYLKQVGTGEVFYLDSHHEKVRFSTLKMTLPKDEGLKITQTLLQDRSFKQKAVVITGKVENGTEYYKTLHFIDDVTGKEYIHSYIEHVSDAPSYDPMLKPETFYNQAGSLVTQFKTGETYFTAPVQARIDYLERVESYRNMALNQDNILPEPPEDINNFKIVTLKDLSEADIAKAKEYIGSPDFRNIMENYMEGSVAILGESGEGKTFIAKQFYNAALAGLIPGFEIQEVLLLTRASMGKGTMYVGQSEERLEAILTYFKEGKGKRLIFADEVHTLKGVGTSAGSPVDALQGMKTAMGEGDFKMIATTTLDEYNGLIGGDVALKRRILDFTIKPKTHDEIMQAVTYNASQRGIEVSDELINKMIRYSSQFDVAGMQPAKAVKLTLKAIAKHKIDFPGEKILSEASVNQSVAQLYNADPKMLEPQFALEKVESLREALDKEVIGLEDAKLSLIEVTKQRYLGMTPNTRPPLRMLLLGPPGVGKSHIAKVFGKGMGYNTVVISLNNYRGHPTADAFLNEVASELQKNAFSNIVLDEFEKGSPAVQESVLQILNDGEFKLQEKMPGSEQTRSIKISTVNANFLLTSNLGDEEIKQAFKDILQIEMEKTQDVKAAEAEATRVFKKQLTKSALENMLTKLGFNTAVMDRMDHILAIPTPNHSEFKANIELYTNLFLSDYKKQNGVALSFKNFDEIVEKLMTHYQVGMSNRDAKKIIQQVLFPEVSKKLTADMLSQKSATLAIDLKNLTFLDKAPKLEEKGKLLINIHELRGHWLSNFLLTGKNASNYVTIIPGDGYLGYVRPKINFDILDQSDQTFSGMLKKIIILEAGHRAQVPYGIYGTGAGRPESLPSEGMPRDDLGKIDLYYETMIANKMFPEVSNNHSSEVKRMFKLQMAEIVREMTDSILAQGISLGVGDEMVEKLQIEGKLHGEYLDSYASKLAKEIKLDPKAIINEAFQAAKSKLVTTAETTGFKPQTVNRSAYSGDLKGLEELLNKVEKMYNDEMSFFAKDCNQFYSKK